jgi:EAL domain-containing protein (putative c-di-GMP-specific phosphodiesterase class I)
MLSSLTYLRNLGVRIALDDFGSGFSSLSCLQRFPFDKVKIDQNFVSGIDRSSQSKLIVKAVAGLCKGLGMTVTAEAVETDAQLDFLASEGCDEAQGYLFSAPRAVSEIPALCERFGVCAATPHGL